MFSKCTTCHKYTKHHKYTALIWTLYSPMSQTHKNTYSCSELPQTKFRHHTNTISIPYAQTHHGHTSLIHNSTCTSIHHTPFIHNITSIHHTPILHNTAPQAYIKHHYPYHKHTSTITIHTLAMHTASIHHTPLIHTIYPYHKHTPSYIIHTGSTPYHTPAMHSTYIVQPPATPLILTLNYIKHHYNLSIRTPLFLTRHPSAMLTQIPMHSLFFVIF